MKTTKKILLLVGCLVVLTTYNVLFDRYSYQNKYQEVLKQNNVIHEHNHTLRKDSVIKQRYFESVYSDNFEPCSVSLECDYLHY